MPEDGTENPRRPRAGLGPRTCLARNMVLATLLIFGVASTHAHENGDAAWDSITSAAEEWARENLDDNVVAAFESGDKASVQKALETIQKQLGGDYVLDLAALKTTVTTLLPVLDQYQETADYAQWLRTRLDYLDVAEELKKRVPKIDPAKPVVLENPPASQQRDIWIEKVKERPWPDKAREYVPRLKPVFEAEKVAPELVWIAEIESSFNPSARSPVGAVGLFQLMPATAKRFGLSTSPIDARKHPGDSARASAKYLKFLHGKFKDWRLALAAYNCGEGTVERLMTKHKATSFDGIAQRLPAETQMYVPKIEAVLLKREGMRLTELRLPTPDQKG